MADRRAEDRAALAMLGAAYEHLPYLDCPYRCDAQGRPLYPQNNDIFGPPHPSDPLHHLMLDLPAGLEALYAPLGAGGHVDHLLINRLARRASVPLYFYEEYPYSANTGEAARISHGAAGQLVGTAALQTALGALGQAAEAHLIPLSQADLAAKIQAIAAYSSQISTFWDSLEAMAQRVRAYAQQVAPGLAQGAERLWNIPGVHIA
jgi:LmbE family N-acetylglucosaminyl deacetylase